MTEKCFLCGNIKRIWNSKDMTWVPMKNDDAELTPMKLKWKMFDGSEHEIDIFKCKECLELEKELLGENIEDRKKEEQTEKVTEDKPEEGRC